MAHEIRAIGTGGYSLHARYYEERYQVYHVTSRGEAPFTALSAYYPHGNIAVPGKPAGTVGHSVEGIWQGLKLFRTRTGRRREVDARKWQLQTMADISAHAKRKRPRGGSILGHSWNGDDGQQQETVLDIEEAHNRIYLPAYRAAIQNSPEAQQALQELAEAARQHPILLVDAHSNADLGRPKLSPVAAVVVPLLRGMLGQPVAVPPQAVLPPLPAELQAVPLEGVVQGPADSESSGSTTESEDRSSEYHSAVPSLASN